jgi:hypothetical protein
MTGRVAAALALAGCVAPEQIAQNLSAAATPSHLPLLTACWEKEFERSSFRGGYVAEVDFVVEGGTSRIKSPNVRSLAATDGGGSDDPAEFRACIEAALGHSVLPTQPDKDGPGFSTGGDLAVKRYRIAFVDASSKGRTIASERQANVLLGPRADRCQGLYAHDPPRDASTVYAAIAEAQQRAAGLASGSREADFRIGTRDQDSYARELQKTFDAQLELRERLATDLAARDVPEANRKRLRKALEDAEDAAEATGAKIGCSVPRLAPR